MKFENDLAENGEGWIFLWSSEALQQTAELAAQRGQSWMRRSILFSYRSVKCEATATVSKLSLEQTL